MKEPELYELIRTSVQKKRKKSFKLTTMTNRDDFYQSELSKRKLVTQNAYTKRKKLFNMFHELDSFVDVSEILRLSMK